MTTARKFYLTFMKLAKQVNKSKTKAQLAKNVTDNLQPLADCFDDHGLDVMDNYHLTSGDMILDYGAEYPLIKSKCDTIKHNSTYIWSTTIKPIKSYMGDKLVVTNQQQFEYLNYPNEKTIQSYMLSLLNMALDNTMNRHNSDREGGFWIDRSGITPLEEYHMRNAVGIKTDKSFISKAKYNQHKAKLEKSQSIKNQIRAEQVKIRSLKSDYSNLQK